MIKLGRVTIETKGQPMTLDRDANPTEKGPRMA